MIQRYIRYACQTIVLVRMAQYDVRMVDLDVKLAVRWRFEVSQKKRGGCAEKKKSHPIRDKM